MVVFNNNMDATGRFRKNPITTLKFPIELLKDFNVFFRCTYYVFLMKVPMTKVRRLVGHNEIRMIGLLTVDCLSSITLFARYPC